MNKQEWIVVGLLVAILLAAGIFMSASQARSARKVMAAACLNNQSMIDSAVESCALANSWTNGTRVELEKVVEFLRGNKLPECHAGGTYIVERVGDFPHCTAHGHLLPCRMPKGEGSKEEPNPAFHGTRLKPRP